jgi:hypothetical protein
MQQRLAADRAGQRRVALGSVPAADQRRRNGDSVVERRGARRYGMVATTDFPLGLT